MENQINVGIQRQSYEPFKAADSEAENSNADASLADDSTGTHTGGNSNIVAPRLEGESVNPAPPEPVASNNTLHRYSMGDTVIMGRPEYAMPDYNPGGSTSTAQNSLPSENTTVRHDATSWMKEASISGSNDSGGSTDSGDEADYGGGGDYSSGGDVGGGGDGGSGPAGGGVDSGGSADGSNDSVVDEHGNGDLDGGGDSYSADNDADSANAPVNTAESAAEDGSRLIGTVPCAATTAQLDTVLVTASRISNDGPANANTGSHGGSLNDYLSADNYGVGSQTNESTNVDSTQSTGTSGYQGAVDAASRLLGKPQGRVTYDDVLGTLTQIRGASQNPELTMREQQALNSIFMAVYTRGNTERVIGPTVTNEFLNAAITSMMFGGGNARIPKPNLPTGPMLPGTTGDFARYRPPGRETWQQSERDIGRWLGTNNRGQVSYLGGREVPHGTPGSVRPDFVSRAGIASFEVKNYNIATNMQALIQNVSSQVIDRARNLPAGMRQQIIIDVRGQSMSDAQRAAIINGIVQQSNGIIQPEDILFIR